MILTAAQQAEIEDFRGEMITLRQELRAVQRSLREDVESLSTWIKVVNIWAVPVLVALLAIGVALWRHARTARAAAPARLTRGGGAMSLRVFLGLLAITVIASVGALVVALERPTTGPVRYVDEPAFPALRENPDAVAKVVLTSPDGTLTLVRETGERWSALERYGYPVDADKVRALIVALADMRLVEAKTSHARALCPARGRGPGAGGRQVAPAAGRERRRQGAGRGDPRQAPAPADRQPAGRHLSAPPGRGAELARERRRRPRHRDQSTGSTRRSSISIRRASGASRSGPTRARATSCGATSAGAPLQLADLAEGEQAKDEADLSRLAGAARASCASRRSSRAPSSPGRRREHTAIATSFDGVELTVRLAKVDDEPWALLDARAVEPLAAPPAAPASDGRPVRRMPASRSRRSRSRTRMARRRRPERRGARRTAAALGLQDLHHDVRPADRAAQRVGEDSGTS